MVTNTLLDQLTERAKVKAQAVGAAGVVERVVNCGTCTACCRRELIFLHPECGDDPAKYETNEIRGRLALKHKQNGDCVYLDRATGCTIHATRPAICREFDCVDSYYKATPALRKVMFSKSMREAVKKRRGAYFKTRREGKA